MARRTKAFFSSSVGIPEIAGSVPKSPLLVELEQALAALRERRDDIYEQYRVASGSLASGKNNPELAAILREINREKPEIDARLADVRRQHSEARQEHLAAVRAALEPRRAVADAAVRSGYAQLLAGWRELDQIAAELRGAGAAGGATERVTVRQVQALIRRLAFSTVGDLDGLKEAGRAA